jgi:hypothetical protein
MHTAPFSTRYEQKQNKLPSPCGHAAIKQVKASPTTGLWQLMAQVVFRISIAFHFAPCSCLFINLP